VLVKFASDGWDAGTEYDEAEDDDNKLPVVCKYYSKFPGMFSVAYGGEDVEVSQISSFKDSVTKIYRSRLKHRRGWKVLVGAAATDTRST